MQQMIHKIRDKYTYWLLLLFAPLEVLPFLCEPESMMGKALLLIKTVLFGILYILYADKQKWYIHVMLLITCVSMSISMLMHGGAGTVLLILTMFFALITFPKIEIEEKRLRNLYFLLAIGGAGTAIYGMILNYINGITAFSWRGGFNPNTFGIILLSVLFYSLSSMHLNAKKISWMDLALFTLMLFLIIKSGCRSALLCVIVLLTFYVISCKTKFGRIAYYVIVAFSVLFCLAMAIIDLKLNISETAYDVMLFGKRVFSGREKVWATALNGFIASPLWGQSNEYLAGCTQLSSAHSVLMGILIATGVIPCIMYLKLLFSPKTLIGYNKAIDLLLINKLFFIACIILTAFECVYTDNRLNLLFLPLLWSCDDAYIGYNPLKNKTNNSDNSDEMRSCKHKKKDSDKISGILALFIVCILMITKISEPVILSITREALSMKADQLYLDTIGYGDENINLLQNKNFESKDVNKVIWEWNGTAYDVIGTAENISAVNLYSSSDKLPDWAEPGKQYHVIFEADTIRFQVYYYLSDGQHVCLVDTTTSIDFTIPEDSIGLIVRIALPEGETAHERVMPIIYAKENEPRAVTEKRETLTSFKDRLIQYELDNQRFETRNLLDNIHNPSKEDQGVKWEWNGESYNVIGTAENISFVNLYSAPDKLPDWVEPGKQYLAIYEADKVRFQIFYYVSNEHLCFIDTTTSTTFSIPEEACGLIIRIALLPGETARENVMPIIYPFEVE